MANTKLVENRILSNIKKDDNGCWIWQGGLRRGYGRIWYGGRDTAVHRLSYAVFNGDITGNNMVLHTCDIRSCCNPMHLFIGTNQDNMDDKVKKGRQARGIKNGGSKLTEESVLKIRKLLSDGVPQGKIGHLFGVDRTTVCDINTRRTWRHL